jgi:RNA recognition motif-containing protein
VKNSIGNFDFSATEPSVRALLEPYARVGRVNVVTDRYTDTWPGFAFVEMTDPAEADHAIAALNGANLEGRALNVNEVRPKTEGGRGDKAAGVSGGSLAGRVYRHGWAMLVVPTSVPK